MNVEPTAQWLNWFRLPLLEIRPWAGLSWGRGSHLLPMGRFPVLPPARSLPASELSLTADDNWSAIANDSFLAPVEGGTGPYRGRIRDVVAYLIKQSGFGNVEVLATSDAIMPKVVWEGSRSDVLVELVESIGAEVFFDRYGLCVIRDLQYPAGEQLIDGESGTVVTIQSTLDWSKVFNRIIVVPASTDASFGPVVAAITNPEHPAHENRIGRRAMPPWSSPAVTTRRQAVRAAPGVLRRASRTALAWTVTALPDPARMAGDHVTIDTDLGRTGAIIEQVTHYGSGADMAITLGAPA